MHTLSSVLGPVVGLFSARREPFREVATVNYEDPDPPAKRGRAKGQMPNFGFAAWGCGTTDCVRVKTELILFSLSLLLSHANFCDMDDAYLLYRVFFNSIF